MAGRYNGELNAAGLRHGEGVMSYSSGETYNGEWKEGLKHGKCLNALANGDVYEGEVKEGKKHGQSTYTFANGSVYKGEFNDDKQFGQGTFTSKTGVYEGDFENDTRTGQGTFTWTDGRVYKGQWRNGKKEGQGTYSWPTGEVYTGEFRDNDRHGQGTYTYRDGSTYDGKWLRTRHGPGVYTSKTSGKSLQVDASMGKFKDTLSGDSLEITQDNLEAAFTLTLKDQNERLQEQLATANRRAEAAKPATCCICLDAPADYLFVPCGHQCLCSGQCHALMVGGDKKECPVCKQKFRELVRVYAQ